jgi:hypothetical protein
MIVTDMLSILHQSADGQVNLLWWDVDFDRTRKAPDTDGTPEYERRKQVRSC